MSFIDLSLDLLLHFLHFCNCFFYACLCNFNLVRFIFDFVVYLDVAALLNEWVRSLLHKALLLFICGKHVCKLYESIWSLKTFWTAKVCLQEVHSIFIRWKRRRSNWSSHRCCRWLTHRKSRFRLRSFRHLTFWQVIGLWFFVSLFEFRLQFFQQWVDFIIVSILFRWHWRRSFGRWLRWCWDVIDLTAVFFVF